MSKRVHFSEDVGDEEGPSSSKKRAFSPPADEMSCETKGDGEEDDQDFVFAKEDEEMGELDIRQFRAQEKTEVDEEDGIKFTAFNLEEEMEDGHFDKAGNFIFKKNTDIRDNWLDDIDWSTIKKQENNSAKVDDSSSDSGSSSSEGEGIDRVAIYEKLVALLQPGESVKQGIRRYGGSVGGNKNRNKAKKETISPEDKEKMNLLIDYANELVNDGEMDIYQFTYEKMNYLIKTASKKNNYASIVSADKDGGEFDMFSDTFDASKPVDKEAKEEEKLKGTLWEYKWKNNEEEEIHGPFPTSKMIEWQNDAYFDEIFVRKVGSKQFYSSKRIDFDLYD